MRVLKSLVIFLAVVGLSGCGSDSGGTAVACTKGITSSWSAVGVNFEMDLRAATIGFTRDYEIAFSNGASCAIEGKLTGQECAGSIVVSDSVWNNDGPSDPGCNSLARTSTFTISGASMVACDLINTTECTSYE